MADPQDGAEATDDDKVGGDYPPDRPLAVHDPPDDKQRDSVDERDERLVPDDERLVAPDSAPVDDGQAVLAEDAEREEPLPAEDAAMHVDIEP